MLLATCDHMEWPGAAGLDRLYQQHDPKGKVCAIQYGGYVPTDACTAIAPNSTNGWIGTECAEASQRDRLYTGSRHGEQPCATQPASEPWHLRESECNASQWLYLHHL